MLEEPGAAGLIVVPIVLPPPVPFVALPPAVVPPVVPIVPPEDELLGPVVLTLGRVRSVPVPVCALAAVFDMVGRRCWTLARRRRPWPVNASITAATGLRAGSSAERP